MRYALTHLLVLPTAVFDDLQTQIEMQEKCTKLLSRLNFTVFSSFNWVIMCPVHFAFLRAFRATTRSNTSKRIFTDVANDLKFWAEHSRPIAHVADCRNPESFSLRSVCELNRLVPKHGPAELRATRCLTRGEFQLRFKTWPWTRSTRYVLFAYSLADTPVWCSAIECAKSRLRSSVLEMTYKSKSATLLTLSPGEGPRAPSTT